MLEQLDQDALISLVVFGILDVIALGLLLAGLAKLIRARLRSGRLARAEATVVEHEKYTARMRTSSGTSSPTMLVKPVLRYSAGGQEYTFVSRIGSNVPPAIGTTVRVAYEPTNPSVVEIDSGLVRYLVPVVLTCVGVLLVAIFTGVGWNAIQ